MDRVTVFRSAESNAKEEAIEVRDLLAEAGIQAEVLCGREHGVMAGAYEVRVPIAQAQDAEKLIAAHSEKIETLVDASHDLDMVPVFSSDAHNAEMLATAIHSLLQANGIPSMIVGAAGFPSLPFEVRVPRARLEEAEQTIRAAEEAGAAAAEEAAQSSTEDPTAF